MTTNTKIALFAGAALLFLFRKNIIKKLTPTGAYYLTTYTIDWKNTNDEGKVAVWQDYSNPSIQNEVAGVGTIFMWLSPDEIMEIINKHKNDPSVKIVQKNIRYSPFYSGSKVTDIPELVNIDNLELKDIKDDFNQLIAPTPH